MIHFIHTGGEFKYQYLLSIKSALRTHNDKVILWSYKDIDIDLPIEVRKIKLPVFKALKNKPDYFKFAHIKDWFTYKILLEEGGLCLDLDTVSIKDATDLLGDKEMMVMTDAREPYKWRYVHSLAICAGRKGSPIIKEAFDRATVLLSQDDIVWADTSTVLISKLIEEYPDKFSLPTIDILGGFEGGELEKMYEDTPLPPDLRIMHLLAYASKEKYTQINEEYIKNNNSLIARLFRETTKDLFFVEIGSNCFDTLEPLAEQGWKGIIVEPVPYYFSKLKRIKGITYEQVGIGMEIGYKSFYYIPEETIIENNLPFWATGIGSFEMHTLIKEHHWERFVKEIKVTQIPIRALLYKYNVEHIDYLKIDTEGYDCKILLSMDLDIVDKILFEKKHCPADELVKVLNKLKDFTLSYQGDNILAIRNKK